MKLLSARAKKRNGFTLVELLIAVVIIAILSGVILSVVNQNTLRARARDKQRMNELSQIATALELYFTDNRSYPGTSGTWIDIGNKTAITFDESMATYYPNYPTDPLYTTSVSSPCNLDGTDPDTLTNYRYNYVSDGSIYILTAVMEDASSDDAHKCSDLTNWTTFGASCVNGTSTNPTSGPDYCYGIQNPF